MAGATLEFHSQHGFAIFYGDNLISWSSHKQNVVACSSTEAENRAIAFATTELNWLQELMRELLVAIPKPLHLFCNNMSATFITSNSVFNDKSKHIKIDFHFVKEQVEAGDLTVKFIQLHYQRGDIFTKVVRTARFQFLKDKLNVHQCPLVCRWGVNGRFPITKSKH